MYTILVPKSASILVEIFVEILYWKQQLSSKKKKCLSSFYKYLSTIAIEWQIRSKSVELNEPKSRCGSNRPRTFHLKSLKICTCFLHVPPPRRTPVWFIACLNYEKIRPLFYVYNDYFTWQNYYYSRRFSKTCSRCARWITNRVRVSNIRNSVRSKKKNLQNYINF